MTEHLDFEQASQLLREGKKEDAYSAFLSIVRVCTEQLQQARFRHESVVNGTQAYERSIACIRKSTDAVERILRPKPPIPPKIQTTHLERLRGNPASLAEEEEEEEVDLVAEFLKLPPRTRSLRVTMGDLLLETVIDAFKLSPAQTPSGDSLSMPSQERATVPLIPVPPLQTLYQQLATDSPWLPKVRSLYMSAMTLPSVLEFRVGVLAYQLTLIESALFRAIPPEALKTHTVRTPHVRMTASTDFFNFLTRTIEHSILLPTERGCRAERVNRWIKVASKLWVLSNYQTLKAVVSALGTPPVQRLRRTWELIPKKQLHRLETMQQLMSETENYCRYRSSAQHSHGRPAIPFLGVLIHDMTYLTAAQKACTPVLDTMARFQRLPAYPQQPPPSFIIKKNLFRSTTTTTTTTTTTCMVAWEEENPSEETMIGLEQQLVMQYILMRPWVSEKTIDMLSQLREPTKRPTSPTLTIRWDEEDRKLAFWPFRKTSQPDSPLSPTEQNHPSCSLPPVSPLETPLT